MNGNTQVILDLSHQLDEVQTSLLEKGEARKVDHDEMKAQMAKISSFVGGEFS